MNSSALLPSPPPRHLLTHSVRLLRSPSEPSPCHWTSLNNLSSPIQVKLPSGCLSLGEEFPCTVGNFWLLQVTLSHRIGHNPCLPRGARVRPTENDPFGPPLEGAQSRRKHTSRSCSWSVFEALRHHLRGTIIKVLVPRRDGHSPLIIPSRKISSNFQLQIYYNLKMGSGLRVSKLVLIPAL